MRALYGIRGHPVTDCLAATFCGACSNIQVRRELDLREQEGALRLGEGADETILVVVPAGDVKEDVAPPQVRTLRVTVSSIF
jgi:hypothetical protein